jgi:hypothetical protein
MDNLATYLNDHLAGSVAALNMIDHLINTFEKKPLAQFFRDLRGEIAADQADLQWLIEKLEKKPNAIRKAGAWVAEKLSRARKFTLANHRRVRWDFTWLSRVLSLASPVNACFGADLKPLLSAPPNYEDSTTHNSRCVPKNSAIGSKLNA